jgi:nucleotide-binding universal stress UspA family protein
MSGPSPARARANGVASSRRPSKKWNAFRARAVDELKIVEALLPGIAVETVVRFGDAKQEILIEAEAWSADLIAIMAGNGGRAVARRVVRRGAAPVMLYQPPTPSRSDVFLRGLEWVVAKGLSGTEVIGLGGRY